MSKPSGRTARWAFLFAWILLCVTSYVFVRDVGGVRYVTDESRTSALEDSLAQAEWEGRPSSACRVEQGSLLWLAPPSPGGTSWLLKDVPVDRPGELRLRASVRAEGLPELNQLAELERNARFVVVSYDRDGKARYDRKHVVVVEEGTSGWEEHAEVFQLGDDVESVKVGLMSFATRGSIGAKDVVVEWVTPRPSALTVMLVLKLLWGFGASLFLRQLLWEIRSPWVRRVLLGALCCLVGFALIPRGLVEGPMGDLAAYASNAMGRAPTIASVGLAVEPEMASLPAEPPSGLSSESPTPKPRLTVVSMWDSGHFIGFLVLAFLLATGRRSHGWSSVTRAVGVGISIEILQLFSPDRTPSASDVAVDFAGALVGVMLYGVLSGSFFRRSTPTDADQ